MRINWIITPHNPVTMYELLNACNGFFMQHKVIPDTVKMTFHDLTQFLSQMPMKLHTLERGKDYGTFIAIPGGMVELLVLEESNETTVNMGGGSMFVVECTQVDREFEKHVLNKED